MGSRGIAGIVDRGTRRFVVASGVFLILALALAPVGLDARQATPGAGSAIVPRPDACRVAPRSLPLLADDTGAPAATPLPLVEPTPFAPLAGEPADAATSRAITAVVREAVACRNAGDYARAYALMSDGMLVRLFGGPATLDPIVAAALEAPPERLSRPDRLALVAVADLRLLPDGRTAARVVTRNAEQTFTDELVFVRAQERWLIDQTIPIDG